MKWPVPKTCRVSYPVLLLIFALLVSGSQSHGESAAPSNTITYPDASGVYVYDGSDFTSLYFGGMGRNPEERKQRETFSPNISILIFQKWIAGANAKIDSIKIRDWKRIDEIPLPEVATEKKPVENHPEMLMLVPKQPLSPGLYTIILLDGSEYLFGVESTSEEEFWNKMLTERPNSWRAHNHLGAVLYMKGDWKGAYPHFLKTVELNPKYAEGHNNLGLTLSMYGKNAEAIEQFEAAVKIKDDSAIDVNLANAYEQVKRYDDAIKTYRHAIELNPNNPSAHCNLGYSLMQEGKVEEAIPEFRKTIELDPNMPEAKSDLEKALQMMQVKGEKF